MGNDESNDSVENFTALIEANARDWSGYWYWGDKPIGEQGAANEILKQAGVEVANLASLGPGQDPPDCEGVLDGRFSGVEVTELIHQKSLERSLKASRDRQAGKEPDRPEVYFVWDQDALVSALQALIDRKDRHAKQRHGAYQRYVLVICTDEFFLDRATVSTFLEGAKFTAAFITDVFLGLSYHPGENAEDGCCPVFPLTLVKALG